MEVRSATLSFSLEELSTEERNAGPCRRDVKRQPTLAKSEVGRRISSIRGRTLVLPLDDDVFASHGHGVSAHGWSPVSRRG